MFCCLLLLLLFYFWHPFNLSNYWVDIDQTFTVCTSNETGWTAHSPIFEKCRACAPGAEQGFLKNMNISGSVIAREFKFCTLVDDVMTEKYNTCPCSCIPDFFPIGGVFCIFQKSQLISVQIYNSFLILNFFTAT